VAEKTDSAFRIPHSTSEDVRAIYIHIPFCVSKCHYCDFVSYPGMQALYQDYTDALISEDERRDPDLLFTARTSFACCEPADATRSRCGLDDASGDDEDDGLSIMELPRGLHRPQARAP
jgi:hypothetical protein